MAAKRHKKHRSKTGVTGRPKRNTKDTKVDIFVLLAPSAFAKPLARQVFGAVPLSLRSFAAILRVFGFAERFRQS
jgi:hypothetical protein